MSATYCNFDISFNFMQLNLRQIAIITMGNYFDSIQFF